MVTHVKKVLSALLMTVLALIPVKALYVKEVKRVLMGLVPILAMI